MKFSNSLRNFILLFIILSSLMSCNVFNSDQKVTPLEFEKMQIQYFEYGGWINTSQLNIQPTGEATAKVLAHGDREVLDQSISMLTELQKEKLALSFASFSHFSRHYQPEEHWTDQNFYKIILSYEGSTDTVSVYNPTKTSLPRTLEQLIADVKKIHHLTLDKHLE